MEPCEVRYVVEGPVDAPTIILVNSLGTDLRMWEPQALSLRDRFRVVRFDSRGHGRSPAPPGPYSLAELGGDLLALQDRLEVERATVCGVSLGGATAIWVARHAPERVDSLIACFTSAYFGPPEPWLERAELVRRSGTRAVADAVLERWFTPHFADRMPDLFEKLRSALLATSAEGYAASVEAVASLDLRPDLAAVQAPTLVVSGADDPATPPEQGRRLAAAIAGAEFVELPNAAHLGNLERPAAVTGLIESRLSV